MTSVSASGLHKAFGPQPVLAGIDLEVKDGSLTAVLGPSGSGKTTLLRILAGFERADRGTVTLAGTVAADADTHLAPERRRIGYVPQDGALFPHLTAAGNIGFGLSRRQRRERRVPELLALVGLDAHGDRYPHQLSGGQQQRVALARALANRPGLVLLDEPFSSLDPSLRAELRAEVHSVLRATGTTAVLVTHDQEEALSLADQVAVLRDGRVAQCATPQELYLRPLDPAIACFLGAANLLEGVIRAGQALTALGPLALAEPGALREDQPVVVLLRPERVDVHPGTRQGGLDGTVLESRYYGHDTMTTIEPGPDGPDAPIHARLAARPPLPPGTPVTLRANGPVTAWPARRSDLTDAAGRVLAPHRPH